jgi:hypothetical protein
MCSERPPTQTLLTLSLPACPPLYSSQTLALQPAESCSSKVDLHHRHKSHVTRHTSHVTRHTSHASVPKSRQHVTEGAHTNQTSALANRPGGNLDLGKPVQNSRTIAQLHQKELGVLPRRPASCAPPPCAARARAFPAACGRSQTDSNEIQCKIAVVTLGPTHLMPRFIIVQAECSTCCRAVALLIVAAGRMILPATKDTGSSDHRFGFEAAACPLLWQRLRLCAGTLPQERGAGR